MPQPFSRVDSAKVGVDQLEKIKLQQASGLDGESNLPDQRQLERKLKFKMDMIVLPMTAISYFLLSMCRSDLGNAELAGLTKDLGITHQQYSNIAGMFYVGYLVVQLPATLLLRTLTPPIQLFLAMLLWGIFTTCLVAARNYGTVLGLRILVGASEGLIQGGIYYLSIIYRPRELATRIAMVFSTSALAGACNGLIAYGIEKSLAGKHGWAAWQWLFLVEGVIPMGFAFIFLVLYPTTPEKPTMYFNAEEQAILVRRSREAQNTGESKFRPALIVKLFLDPVFWLLVCVYAGPTFGLASLTNFLPAIIKSFGWSSVHSQAMSVIVYAIAWATTNLWAVVSDRIGQRAIIISGNALFAVIGFILLLTVTTRAALFAGACIVMAGLYPCIALTITWVPNLLVGHMYRASGLALVNAFAQAVSVSASQAYINPAHSYRNGNIVALCMMAFSGVMAAVLRLWLWRQNSKKAANEGSFEATEMRKQTVDVVGNKHPDFYFTY